jgi:hypothetical protein
MLGRHCQCRAWWRLATMGGEGGGGAAGWEAWQLKWLVLHGTVLGTGRGTNW